MGEYAGGEERHHDPLAEGGGGEDGEDVTGDEGGAGAVEGTEHDEPEPTGPTGFGELSVRGGCCQTRGMGDVLLLAVCFASAVVMAAGEAALLRIPPGRAAALSEAGRRGRRVAALIADLPRVLNTILLVALLSQIAAATIAAAIAADAYGDLGVTVGSVVLTFLLFVYGEAIPKTFAVRHPERVALVLAGLLRFLEVALRPVVAVLVWIADMQLPGKGVATAPTVTERELLWLAGRAAREGQITAEDLDLIARAFRVGDRQVNDVMVPRGDIVGVPADTPAGEALKVALEAGHRRIVVYGDSVEEISGMVRLRDLAALEPERRGVPVGSLARPVLVVPETAPVISLLRDMQRSSTHLAVVVDEFGGTEGLVTVEDIVEELLGSIGEDPDEEPIQPVGPGRWVVDGALPVEDLEALVGPVPTGPWNTVAGLAMGAAGRTLEEGDVVDLGSFRLRVVAARGRRLRRIEVETTRPTVE